MYRYLPSSSFALTFCCFFTPHFTGPLLFTAISFILGTEPRPDRDPVGFSVTEEAPWTGKDMMPSQRRIAIRRAFPALIPTAFKAQRLLATITVGSPIAATTCLYGNPRWLASSSVTPQDHGMATSETRHDASSSSPMGLWHETHGYSGPLLAFTMRRIFVPKGPFSSALPKTERTNEQKPGCHLVPAVDTAIVIRRVRATTLRLVAAARLPGHSKCRWAKANPTSWG
ncbi:hypothetical protein QBC41DRAFT_2427 [Cercophora samala]|uniref:Uncharacterized protein n=1 Tax=Cercophora samala TaxID=330535 RepID=A0AA39ZNL9_9PEZI|nr:hypothetical protein QBC41DRAFT_2427 [Cercophora samala]